MKCPRCGEKTLVLDSRSSDAIASKVGWLATKVREVLRLPGDYRVRQRLCGACNKRSVTVEVFLPDVETLEPVRQRPSDD